MIEIKYKNKKFLWVNTRDYLDYIKWENITLIPVYIVMYVNKDNNFYVHELEKKVEVLNSFRTKHDKNEVFDVEDKSIKILDEKDLINFFKGITY